MLYTRDAPLGKKYNMIMRDKDEYYRKISITLNSWIMPGS